MEAYGRFAEVYDALMRDVDYDGWCDYLAGLIRARVGVAASVLDAACGTGSMTVRLARQGFSVTGSDASPDMLRVAAEKARRQGLKIPFVQQTLETLCVLHPVDVVNCACDGVNYLLTDAQLAAFLSSARACLRPGGWLLFDVSSAHKLQNVLGCNTFGDSQPECTYLWCNMFDEKNGLAELQLNFFVPRGRLYERFDETHIQRAYSVEALTAALEQAGYDRIQAFDALTERPPRGDGERIQWLARRNDGTQE